MASNPGSTVAPAWRQFSFFEAATVKDTQDLASPPEIFKSVPEVSAIASASVGLLVADIHGAVNLLTPSFEIDKSWTVHQGGRVTHMVEKQGILVTLGDEDTSRHPILNIWDLEHTKKATGLPLLLRSSKVQHGNHPHPISTIALADGLAHLAIGLSDGTVLFYRQLDQYLFSNSTSVTHLPKPKVIHESKTEPVTGMGFKEPYKSDDGRTDNLYLFIVTINHVLCYQVTGRGSGGAPVVVDEVGCNLNCAVLNNKATGMIIARDEAIYAATTEGRGSAWAYEGPKSSIIAHRNYVVIVSPPFVPSAGSASATVRNYVARAAGTGADISKVTVFDLENKFVAHSGTFKEGVREVFTSWGVIFVLTNDGKLYRLNEISTSAKLEILFSKPMFPLAIAMGKTQGLEAAALSDIYRRYGDHLYAKGEFENAMQQYLQTIGQLQPSYVIRKYLDAQRIHNLATYLQELHAKGLANSDHTTLLINTYTKLKDVSRLDAFIKAEPVSGAEQELPFDLDTVIRVCRQAGYYDHAVYLAKKYNKHEDYLRIQIEDAGNYKDALNYLKDLGLESAEGSLGRYGRLMLTHLPKETTQILIDICVGTLHKSPEQSSPRPSTPDKDTSGGPSYLSYLPMSNRTSAAVPDSASTTTTIKNPPGSTFEKGHQRFGSVNRASIYSSSRASSPPPTAAKAPEQPIIKRPSPRVYFAHFLDHPEYFIQFLEAIVLARWGQRVDDSSSVDSKPSVQSSSEDDEEDKQDQIAVWNTLLELYLTLSSNYMSQDPPNPSASRSFEGKALQILKSSFAFDSTHALLVCSTRGFTEGMILLWERLGMYEDILRFWMDKENQAAISLAHGSALDQGGPPPSTHVLKYLDKHGPQHPYLYPLVLRFLTSTPVLLQRHTKELSHILERIEEEKIMPPLLVVQVLSRNNVASVGLVKGWLMRRMEESRDEIEADRRLIESYRSETAAKIKEIQELSDADAPRVFHVTRCSSCANPLDLPSIHFMCKHSYHQRCLQSLDNECPICARQHGVIREIRRNNERLADQHDLFIADVEETGFNAVAGAFSRGLMGIPKSEEPNRT